MPFGDGTGPRGFGPATGRGTGYCTGYATPGYANFRPRWFCGGGGRGRRNQYYATGLTGWQRAGMGWADAGTPYTARVGTDVELATLKDQAENLARTLDGIRKRIETLETQDRRNTE